MGEYTFKDVIIDPNDPRVEIGAEYYFSDSPKECLWRANGGMTAYKLEKVVYENRPFVGDDMYYICILRKKEPTYTERQAEWIADNGIKRGDRVRVTRKANSYEQGWDNLWIQRMDEAVGKVGTVYNLVSCFKEGGIEVNVPESGCFSYPYFCLEKVEEPEKKYVPFDLSKEEDRAKLRGAWVRPKDCYPNVDHLIRGISNITVWFGDSYLNAQELLNEYEFIDGSPCGKIVED